MRLQVRKVENFLVTRFRKRGKEVSNSDIPLSTQGQTDLELQRSDWQRVAQAPQHELAATPEAVYTFVNDNKIALW